MTRRQVLATTLAITLLWLFAPAGTAAMELAGIPNARRRRDRGRLPGARIDAARRFIDTARLQPPRDRRVAEVGQMSRMHGSADRNQSRRRSPGSNRAVAAVTSHNRRSGCWAQRDVDRIAKATGYEGVTNAGPATVSLGASSGGSIAVLVPNAIVACVAQIMASPLELDAAPVRFGAHVPRYASRGDDPSSGVRFERARRRRGRVDCWSRPLSAAALFRRGAGPGGAVLPSRGDG